MNEINDLSIADLIALKKYAKKKNEEYYECYQMLTETRHEKNEMQKFYEFWYNVFETCEQEIEKRSFKLMQ